MKQPTMHAAFVRWALDTPGVYNYSEATLREEMKDEETYMGAAWQSWKAAWRLRGTLLTQSRLRRTGDL